MLPVGPPSDGMQEALEAEGVTVEFTADTDDRAYVGYETNVTDTSSLATELRLVVETVLDQRPGTAVRGAVFHTENPVVALWEVESQWAEQWDGGDLPGPALLVEVLRTLRTAQF